MSRNRPRERSVRSRATLSAVGVVLLGLTVAGISVSEVVRHSVQDSALATAQSRTRDVVTELTADGRVTSGLNLDAGPDRATTVTVLDGSTVVARTPTAQTTVDRGDPHTVTAEATVTSVVGADRVAVTQGYAAGMHTVDAVRRALVIAVPLLTLLVGGLTFVLTGRSLRPVERIRRRSAQISQADPDARLDVPRTGDEIERLVVTLNAMLDRLHEAYDAQARFVADASHELRTPLAAMRTEIEVANDGSDTAARLLAINRRMQQIVDDLLTLARPGEPGWRPVDLDDVVESVGYASRPTTTPRVLVDTSPVRVQGDPHALTRVVQNLLDNAVRSANTTVRLTLRAESGHAVLDVDDDGPGVPEAERERIFDRFVRLDASRARDSGGSGLGLAIVRAIADAHHGAVTCLGSPLGGARFRLTLPVEPAQPSGSTR